MTRLHVSGGAAYALAVGKMKKEFGSVLPFSHNHGAWEVEDGRLCLLCEREAQAFTGNYFMCDAQIRTTVSLENGEQALVALRAQGARRGYYAGLSGEGALEILCMDAGRLTVLARTAFDWHHGEPYELTFRAKGDELWLTTGETTLHARDGRHAYGMAGLGMFRMGRASFGDLWIQDEGNRPSTYPG